MNVCVVYRHSFICDVFENMVSLEEAKERAIEKLKMDFPKEAFPLITMTRVGTEREVIVKEVYEINNYEDLIEDISECSDDDEEDDDFY